MRTISTVLEVKSVIKSVRKQGKTIGFVPTMGCLHQGHLKLMSVAKSKTDFVIASIFVNPLQFGVGEDYEDYPRDLSQDAYLADSAGVDVIFLPSVKEMYPLGYGSFVEVPGITDRLCGKSRPGHFRGVTTVVTKLFNIVQPDVAYFGQKDAQQSLVLQKMVADLNMDLQIEIVPIVRESDGLAMSSRNAFLTTDERQASLVLSRSLEEAKKMIAVGQKETSALIREISSLITREPLARIDYVEILSVPDLEKTEYLTTRNLIALAVFFGQTRIIDNAVVEG